MENIPTDIISRAAKGDVKAFEEIYKTASGFVYTVVLRIVNNQTEAEEVTQEVFIKIFRNLRNFQFRSSLKTWIYRIAVNSAINAYRRRAREQRRAVDFETVSSTLEAPGDHREHMHKQDHEKILSSLLDSLSPEQRSCIVLRELEGLSYKEISDALKVNINTVRTRIKRARQTLMTCRNGEVIKNEL